MDGIVVSVSSNASHSFSKTPSHQIELLSGLGVEGDAHCGATVKHRSRVVQNPLQANLRQVHLIHRELLDELAARGFNIQPGQLGENITTSGIDLLHLPENAELNIGDEVLLRVTGLRNPCVQLDHFKPGLMSAVLARTPEGKLIRKAGVMSVVVTGGVVRCGDAIRVTLPAAPHRALDRV